MKAEKKSGLLIFCLLPSASLVHMRHLHLLPCLFVMIALFTSSEARAWGTKAHRVMGMLAEERLTPGARNAVNEILAGDDLAAATVWADEMRDSPANREFWTAYAANWHYVNIARNRDYASSPKNPRGDAYSAMQTFVAILLDDPLPEGPVLEGLKLYFGEFDAKSLEVKQFALKFLLHILGDLQQPLHSGLAEDRGGNQVDLKWFGEPANLHSLWDTLLLEQQNRSVQQIRRRLSERIGRTPASDIRTMESADPLLWMQESQRLLERIYAKHSGTNEFGNAYAAEFVPTVEAQLVKGGLRTAYFLNSIFGGWPVAGR
jgi:hypothetical protein